MKFQLISAQIDKYRKSDIYIQLCSKDACVYLFLSYLDRLRML